MGNIPAGLSFALRRTSAIILLLLLCLPVAGTFTWLQVQKSALRREVKHRIMEGIDRDALVLLRFSKAGAASVLDWEHAGEFEYRGQMYDVVERSETADSVSYWCWDDREESQLNQQLARLTRDLLGKDQQRQERQERVITFLKSLYHSMSIPQVPGQRLSAKARGTEYTDFYTSLSLSPGLPPPRQA